MSIDFQRRLYIAVDIVDVVNIDGCYRIWLDFYECWWDWISKFHNNAKKREKTIGNVFAYLIC